MFFNYLSLYSIKTIHLGIIGYVILIPFTTNNKKSLKCHSTIVSSIMLHWFFNDEICILTLAEYKIKKRLFKKI